MDRSVLKALTPLAAVLYSSAIGCLLLLVPAMREGSFSPFAVPSLVDCTSLVFLGLLGTAVGFSLYYQAICKIGATRSGVSINLVPFFSILLSWVILGEAIKPAVLSGGVLLLAGVTLTNLQQPKCPDARPDAEPAAAPESLDAAADRPSLSKQ